MKKLLLEDGVIENIIEVAESDDTDFGETLDYIDDAEIGDSVVDGELLKRTLTDEETAAEEEAEASAAEAAEKQAYADTVMQDSFCSDFKDMSPAELDDYIEANVTDNASLTEFVQKIASLLLINANNKL